MPKLGSSSLGLSEKAITKLEFSHPLNIAARSAVLSSKIQY